MCQPVSQPTLLRKSHREWKTPRREPVVAQVDGTFGIASLTMAAGFTNNGAIELTSTASDAVTVAVGAGTLADAAGGRAPGPAAPAGRPQPPGAGHRGRAGVAVAASIPRPFQSDSRPGRSGRLHASAPVAAAAARVAQHPANTSYRERFRPPRVEHSGPPLAPPFQE
jgi:hypothetical protein